MTCVSWQTMTPPPFSVMYNVYRRELYDVCILADNDTITIQCHVYVYRSTEGSCMTCVSWQTMTPPPFGFRCVMSREGSCMTCVLADNDTTTIWCHVCNV